MAESGGSALALGVRGPADWTRRGSRGRQGPGGGRTLRGMSSTPGLASWPPGRCSFWRCVFRPLLNRDRRRRCLGIGTRPSRTRCGRCSGTGEYWGYAARRGIGLRPAKGPGLPARRLLQRLSWARGSPGGSRCAFPAHHRRPGRPRRPERRGTGPQSRLPACPRSFQTCGGAPNTSSYTRRTASRRRPALWLLDQV